MDKVPGLMRLGLTAQSPGRVGAGFDLKQGIKGGVVAFDKAPGSSLGGTAAALTGAGFSGSQSFGASGGGAAGGASSGSGRLQRTGTEPFVPPRFALAGLRLTFRGYFSEGVPESALESSRKRHLVLQYYLEDDTLEIVEPAVRNDGLPHGKFLKRMKLPGISPETLRVGELVEVFGRVIHLYACDEFTRKYYDGLGTPQEGDEGVDKDAWSKTQEMAFARNDPTVFHGVKSSSITRFIEAARGSQRTSSFKKDVKGRYLAHDGQVLRFQLLWDDTHGGKNIFGEQYIFWLSYFLASEECEIKEAKGKKQFMGWPTLLKRARLPRKIMAHDDRMRSVEDVTGDEDYYNEDDFRVGSTLSVFGRTMLVCDCDDFTQRWYEENKGVDQKAARVETARPPPPKPVVPVPPHPGFGSEEDTLEAWKHLVPRQPKLDLKKLRDATGATVRYLARLVASDPINSERVFRITLFLDDNEMAVYEPKVRNSGMEGGVFQKKRRTKNVATGDFFKPSDLFVGADVTIKGHRMVIFEEERQPAPPVADVDAVIRSLKKKLLDASASLRKMFRKFDTDKSQSISFEEFQSMLHYYSLGVNKYEAITLFKAFEDEGRPGFMSYSNFMRAFNRAEDEVMVERAEGPGTVSRELTARHSPAELEAMIEEAKAAARMAEYEQEQELLVARISRNFKNAKTAQAVHDNFRRFDANKDHLISKDEFQLTMRRFVNLTEREVVMLTDKFYPDGESDLDYEHFMAVIHEYADKVIRTY